MSDDAKLPCESWALKMVEALRSGTTSRAQLFRETFDGAHAAWEQAYRDKLAGRITKQQYHQAWDARANARKAWEQAREQ